ncbi:MAG: hypothetical protein IJW29_06335 [Clostridia bacterium]|nr:hypothetical protein [Clostridia bacterium]
MCEYCEKVRHYQFDDMDELFAFGATISSERRLVTIEVRNDQGVMELTEAMAFAFCPMCGKRLDGTFECYFCGAVESLDGVRTELKTKDGAVIRVCGNEKCHNRLFDTWISGE